MEKSFIDVVKSTKYKLTGNGPRNFGALMEAFENLDPSTASDMYGAGAAINDFEEEIAKLLGKEKAVFFPSGTMAQQIALRIWSDRLNINKVVPSSMPSGNSRTRRLKGASQFKECSFR